MNTIFFTSSITCNVFWCGVDTDLSDSDGNVGRQPADSVTDRSSSIQEPLFDVASLTADYNRQRLLATYAPLPRRLALTTARPLQLARIGFFYVGRRRLCCYFCGVQFPLLEGHESNATERHADLSPTSRLQYGDSYSTASEALLHAILSWAPLAVEVRQDGVNARDLKINLR